MKIIKEKIEDIRIDEKLAIALGTFDGLHYGHRKIMDTTVKYAKEHGIKSAVMTFDKIPLSFINPSLNIKILMDNDAKCQAIEELNVDYLIFIEFDEEFSKLSYKDFIKYVKFNLNASAIICGYNYTFGYKGMGDSKLLKEYKDEYGYDIIVVDRVIHNGCDVSSSIIRDKMLDGKIDEANNLLGYNYFINGKVIIGKKLGNKLGFPTANIKIPENLALKNGVYITCTEIDGIKYKSITNVGHNPTIEKSYRVAETHVLYFQGNLYSSTIKVEFISYIREEKKFLCIEELKQQVKDDINAAINIK